jgi:hypothetical protein
MTFLVEQPRSNDVVASTDSRLLSLSERTLRAMIDRDPATVGTLHRNFARQLCSAPGSKPSGSRMLARPTRYVIACMDGTNWIHGGCPRAHVDRWRPRPPRPRACGLP